MPVTTLDPNTALIIVDLQQGIIGMAAGTPLAPIMAQVVAHAATLAEAFRRHALPVVLVNVNAGATGRTEAPPRVREFPAAWTELVPELNQQPSDHLVTKRTWGAFSNTDLAQHLASLGVTQVVVTGVATSAGVESTARQAHELGLNVTLASDAMADMNPDAHTNSLTRIFPRIGETGRTQQIIALLDQRQS